MSIMNKRMTLTANGNYIEPMLFGIAFVVVVISCLLIANNTLFRRGFGKFTRFNSSLNSMFSSNSFWIFLPCYFRRTPLLFPGFLGLAIFIDNALTSLRFVIISFLFKALFPVSFVIFPLKFYSALFAFWAQPIFCLFTFRKFRNWLFGRAFRANLYGHFNFLSVPKYTTKLVSCQVNNGR